MIALIMTRQGSEKPLKPPLDKVNCEVNCAIKVLQNLKIGINYFIYATADLIRIREGREFIHKSRGRVEDIASCAWLARRIMPVGRLA